MNPPDQPCQATPAGDLRQQIIDSRVPKNEREWWASREIEKLERELAAAKAECERLTANQRQPAEDIFVSHLCDEITRLRAEVERWKTVAAEMSQEREHNANEASRLRAEVERLTAKIGNQADRIRYLEGATNHATGTPLSQAIARAEKAEAELADWSVLNLWGGTPEIVHKFIKGQQARIHHCQDLEAELTALAAERDSLRAEVERLNDCCDELHYIIDNAGYPSGKDYADMTARAEKAGAALAFIAENGGTTHETECGTIACNGSWCAEQARAAIDAARKEQP